LGSGSFGARLMRGLRRQSDTALAIRKAKKKMLK
jgi:hypothetical protein